MTVFRRSRHDTPTIDSRDSRLEPGAVVLNRRLAELEREVEQLRGELRDFWFHHPDGYLEVDLFNLRVRRLNHVARKMLGHRHGRGLRLLAAADVFGDGSEHFLTPPPSAHRELPYEKTVLGRAMADRQFEVDLIRSDGSVFRASARAAYVLDRDGVPARVRLSFRACSQTDE